VAQGTTSCSIGDCSRQHWSRGMCSLHYQRWRKHGSADIALRAPNGTSASGCSAGGCGYVDPHGLVHGLCRKHYGRERGVYQVGKPPIEARPCAHCGQTYRPRTRHAGIYCTRKCKELARAPKKSLRTCPHCGDRFMPIHAGHFLCSRRCSSAAHRLQSKFRSRAGELTRPDIWRYKIAERDGWRCGICGMPVSPTARYPDPLQATLDHILPVSRGGSNDPSNLRLAHMGCNRSRGNRMEAHASP
jgi:hypothetical protein